MTQPSIDSWESWLQTWRCSTPEMAAELAGRVAAVVEGETRLLLEQLYDNVDRREGLMWCLDQIKDMLASRPCCHGERAHESTPPMMYPEWIMCVLKNETDELRGENERLREQLNACCLDRDAKWIELNRLLAENERLRVALVALDSLKRRR